MPSIEDAIQLALEVHRGSVDKAGDSYILHPLRVMLRMGTEQERMAAVLHDVVEDSAYTLEELRRMGYSETVVQAVDCLTRRKAEGESYSQFIQRLKPNPLARRVKIADLEDNMDIRRLLKLEARDAERLQEYLEAWRELRQAE